MSGYTKLFGSILESTVWLESPPTKVVWITLLAMADRDGVIEASVPGLAKRAGVEREQCERAIALFAAPDIDSRTKAHDGRRIEVVEGGWRLLNHDIYRHKASTDEARNKAAERQRRKRARERDSVTNVTSAKSHDIAEAEAEAEAEQTPAVAVACISTPSEPRQGMAPLHQSHRSHAACGRVCVPGQLHAQFMRTLNRDAADMELRTWYSAVNHQWTTGPYKDENPGGSDYAFWRARFEERWPAARKVDGRLPSWAASAIAAREAKP